MTLHRSKEFFALGLFSWTLLIIGLSVAVADDSKKQLQRITFDSDPDKTQEINILVQPRAEGDVESSADETNPEEVVEGSTYQDCDLGQDCCFQYTWPGHDVRPSTSSLNNTCEWLKNSKGKTVACFDPLVYTTEEGKGTGGPNLTELIEGAAENPSWKIYCKRNQRSCLRYRFYNNDKGKSLVNETLFCGTVSETLSEKSVSNGCYKEKVMGVVKEICVCSSNRCNGAASKYLSLIPITSAFFLTLIFSHWTSH